MSSSPLLKQMPVWRAAVRSAQKRWLEPARRRGRQLEIALLTGTALLALGALSDARFATLRDAACGWALVAPVLVALVHGMLPGLFAGISVAATLHGLDPLPGVSALQTGGLFSTLLAGFAGHLTDIRRRAQALLADRLQGQSADAERQFREQEILRASHALLSERLSAEQWSLAGSVQDALTTLSRQPLDKAASTLLSLLEAQAQVRAAALYISTPAGLPESPRAKLGALSSPSSHHIALRTAFQGKRMVVPQLAAGSAPHLDQDVVLVVPIVTSDDQGIGVIAVHDLPFAAMHDGHFTLIATLVNRCADALREAQQRSAATLEPANERASAGAPRVSLPLPTRIPSLPTAARKLAARPPAPFFARAVESALRPAAALPSLPPPSIDLRTRMPRLPPVPRTLAPLPGSAVAAISKPTELAARAAPGAALESGLRAAPLAGDDSERSRQASGA